MVYMVYTDLVFPYAIDVFIPLAHDAVALYIYIRLLYILYIDDNKSVVCVY